MPESGVGGAGNHFEQGGLPCPVPAHDGPAFAAADGEAEAVIDDARAVALVQVFNHRHLVAGARRHAELELHYLALLGQFDLVDLVQRLDAALHLRGFGGVGFEALDEALLLGEHGLLAGEGRLLIVLADGAFALVEIVVAGVGDDLARIDLGDFGDDAVHELAIVRGHQQRAGVALEELLQPDDGFDVEVVGGLVHQQNIGTAEQDARQRDAHLPAAGERADIAIDLVVLEAEPVQHFARLRLQRVAAEMLVLLLHFAETFEDAVHVAGLLGIFHGVLQALEFVVQIADAAAAGDGFVEHRTARHLFHVLAKVADGELPGDRNVALVRHFLAHDHAEKRGFAGAVRPDQADLLARIELERGVDEDQLLAVLLVDTGERNHRNSKLAEGTGSPFAAGGRPSAASIGTALLSSRAVGSRRVRNAKGLELRRHRDQRIVASPGRGNLHAHGSTGRRQGNGDRRHTERGPRGVVARDPRCRRALRARDRPPRESG